MGFNIIVKTIERYLGEVAGNHSEEGLAELLRCALLRPLRKELSRQDRPDNLEELGALPKGAPGWLRQSFNEKVPVYGFAPRAEMREAIAHVADWLAAALINKEAWLRDVDEQGRPKKLVKLGSLERAKKEADKAMLLAAQNGAASLYEDENGHEKTEMVFDGGYRMVRLLTPQALDKESAEMGHCIGAGGYDQKVSAGSHAFYSLRDAFGKSHATLEVERGSEGLSSGQRDRLVQCQGKENRPPVAKYMPLIQSFVRERKFELWGTTARTGLIEYDGAYYDVCNLPEGFRVEGDLDLDGTGVETLPAGLTVSGSLNLWATAITALPKGLSVGERLGLGTSQVKVLPEGLRIGGTLDLGGTRIERLPDGLTVGGSLFLCGALIERLPEGLVVGGSLDLYGTRIERLPEGLAVEGDLGLGATAITALPEGLTVGGDLDVSDTAIAALPERLTVGGNLNVSRTELRALPEGLAVTGNLDVSETALTELPEGLTVGGKLDVSRTAITALPESLTVGGNLNVSQTALTELPEGLAVGGKLNLSGTAIVELPADLRVSGDLDLQGTGVRELAEGLDVQGCVKLPNGDWYATVGMARMALADGKGVAPHRPSVVARSSLGLGLK